MLRRAGALAQIGAGCARWQSCVVLQAAFRALQAITWASHIRPGRCYHFVEGQAGKANGSIDREAIMQRTACSVGFAFAACVLAAPATAQPQKIGAPPQALNMRLVGTNDLQGRSA